MPRKRDSESEILGGDIKSSSGRSAPSALSSAPCLSADTLAAVSLEPICLCAGGSERRYRKAFRCSLCRRGLFLRARRTAKSDRVRFINYLTISRAPILFSCSRFWSLSRRIRENAAGFFLGGRGREAREAVAPFFFPRASEMSVNRGGEFEAHAAPFKRRFCAHFATMQIGLVCLGTGIPVLISRLPHYAIGR